MENKHPSSSNEKQVISQQSDLPDVVIFDEILTRLPIKSILRFKSVSKQWYSTLSSSNFGNIHFKKSPFSDPCAPVNALIIQNGYDYYVFYYNDEEDDQISRNNFQVVKLDTSEFLVEREEKVPRLVESCNGLICISVERGRYFFLWNPVTCKVNQYTPQDEYSNRFEEAYRITYGFGYVSSIDDYKIVAIRMVNNNQGNSSKTMFALIFSLRENRWRKIDLDNNNIIGFGHEPAVYVSEKLYWCASSDNNKMLVSFDLAAERYDNVIEVDWYRTEKLGVSKGCLHKFNWDTFKVDILKPPPVIVKSIELPEGLLLDMCSQIIGFTKTDKLFVTEWPSNFFEYRFSNVRTLGIVDTCTTPLHYTHLLNFDKVPFRIAGYVPSLVSPFTL